MKEEKEKGKNENSKARAFRSGYVSIIGRPNAGKSTLLNTILGQKVSIVTKKPQTTRNRIIGIKTLKDAQIVFMDTPGIHKKLHTKLDEAMMREARDAMREVDVVLFMVEPKLPGAAEKDILDLIIGGKKGKAGKNRKAVLFLLINKVDSVRKSKLLPVIQAYSELYGFDEVIPISALTGDGVDLLLERLPGYLPEGPMYYPEDLVTDQLERFMVSEIIREKVMEATFEEVPHAVAVEVTRWEEPQGEGGPARGLVRISADIWVERDSQKGIIIGKGGRMLKDIGQAARLEAEKLLNARVFLELWVKLRKDWRSDTKSIPELGF